jgi:hypothetical protein
MKLLRAREIYESSMKSSRPYAGTGPAPAIATVEFFLERSRSSKSQELDLDHDELQEMLGCGFLRSVSGHELQEIEALTAALKKTTSLSDDPTSANYWQETNLILAQAYYDSLRKNHGMIAWLKYEALNPIFEASQKRHQEFESRLRESINFMCDLFIVNLPEYRRVLVKHGPKVIEIQGGLNKLACLDADLELLAKYNYVVVNLASEYGEPNTIVAYERLIATARNLGFKWKLANERDHYDDSWLITFELDKYVRIAVEHLSEGREFAVEYVPPVFGEETTVCTICGGRGALWQGGSGMGMTDCKRCWGSGLVPPYRPLSAQAELVVVPHSTTDECVG